MNDKEIRLLDDILKRPPGARVLTEEEFHVLFSVYLEMPMFDNRKEALVERLARAL